MALILQRFRSKTAVITLLLIMVASLFTVIMLQNNFATSITTLANSEPLWVSINPSGPIQLQLNQSQILVANTDRQDVPLTYSWSVHDASSNLAFNETNYLLVTQGNHAVFKFLTGKLDICWLSVTSNSDKVSANSTVTIQYITLPQTNQTSQQTTNQQTNQPSQTTTPTQIPIQNQEYTAPISNPLPSADLIVQNDAKNHYQVLNATDNSIISSYSSSSANSTLNDVIATGGTIFIMSGDYSGSLLIVPSNSNVISSPDVTGIKYASIGNGAKINEPTFNAAFGGYRGGSYTIAVNQTANAFSNTTYLAFDSDNSIKLTSTDAATVINYVTEIPNTIDYLSPGTYIIASPTPIFIASNTTFYGAGDSSKIYKSVNSTYGAIITLAPNVITSQLSTVALNNNQQVHDLLVAESPDINPHNNALSVLCTNETRIYNIHTVNVQRAVESHGRTQNLHVNNVLADNSITPSDGVFHFFPSYGTPAQLFNINLNHVIVNNTISAGKPTGIEMCADNSTIRNFLVQNVAGNGIVVRGHNITIKTGIIINTGQHGIASGTALDSTNSSNINIFNASISNEGAAGIEFTNSISCGIYAGTIIQNTTTQNIRLISCFNTTIEGIKTFGSVYDVLVDGATNFNVIINNDFTQSIGRVYNVANQTMANNLGYVGS